MSAWPPDGPACCAVQEFQQKLQGDLGAVFPPAAFSTATVSGIALSSSAASQCSGRMWLLCTPAICKTWCVACVLRFSPHRGKHRACCCRGVATATTACRCCAQARHSQPRRHCGHCAGAASIGGDCGCGGGLAMARAEASGSCAPATGCRGTLGTAVVLKATLLLDGYAHAASSRCTNVTRSGRKNLEAGQHLNDEMRPKESSCCHHAIVRYRCSVLE